MVAWHACFVWQLVKLGLSGMCILLLACGLRPVHRSCEADTAELLLLLLLLLPLRLLCEWVSAGDLCR